MFARAFSMAGAFALVRFRSVPGSAKDIAIVFFAMASGLACGLGYVTFACVFVCDNDSYSNSAYSI